VREKKVSSRRIDDAVRRILKIKFELGLFEKRYALILPGINCLLIYGISVMIQQLLNHCFFIY
ncbi:MAG: hypothetical protein KH178_15750, partial [Roseburia sp.]|nr:hypothetical protein [Roseburia sp.]